MRQFIVYERGGERRGEKRHDRDDGLRIDIPRVARLPREGLLSCALAARPTRHNLAHGDGDVPAAPGRRGATQLRRLGHGLMVGGAALALCAGWIVTAWAADSAGAGPSDTLFLVQIVVLIFFGRLMGELMQRIGQPAVMGQLLAGLLLGPSVLGTLWRAGQHAFFPPSHEQKSMLDAVSQLGILMLLLLTGMETDLKLVRRVGRAAISVSVTGICVPLACGFVLGQDLP